MSIAIPPDKKIFFLFPHPVILESMIRMVEEGYTVYAIDNKTELLNALLKFPNSIAYINFDNGKEHEWEDYIKLIWDTPGMINIKLGILTFYKYKKDKYAAYYLSQLGLQCGFICLNSNKSVCTALLLRILELNEAKGRRKYVRAQFTNNTFFNFKYKNMQYTGKILDISIVGMACYFDQEEIFIDKEIPIPDIQLIIKGMRCIINGYVLNMRKQQDEKYYIIMFAIKEMNNQVRFKLCQSIYLQIQEEMKLCLAG